MTNIVEKIGNSKIVEKVANAVNRFSATNFAALPGRGAKALVEGKSIEIGGPRLLTEANVTMPPDVEELTTEWASDGKTVLYTIAEGRLLGALACRPKPRPG